MTRRELQVLCQVCEGLLDRDIAQDLDISIKTVEHHMSSVYMKLEAVNRAQAIVKALKSRVVVPRWLGNEMLV